MGLLANSSLVYTQSNPHQLPSMTNIIGLFNDNLMRNRPFVAKKNRLFHQDNEFKVGSTRNSEIYRIRLRNAASPGLASSAYFGVLDRSYNEARIKKLGKRWTNKDYIKKEEIRERKKSIRSAGFQLKCLQ